MATKNYKKKMSLDQLREYVSKAQTEDQANFQYTCVCGTKTDFVCPKCQRPNCLSGYHPHFCVTIQKMQLG